MDNFYSVMYININLFDNIFNWEAKGKNSFLFCSMSVFPYKVFYSLIEYLNQNDLNFISNDYYFFNSINVIKYLCLNCSLYFLFTLFKNILV